jgi:hypothetical protein
MTGTIPFPAWRRWQPPPEVIAEGASLASEYAAAVGEKERAGIRARFAVLLVRSLPGGGPRQADPAALDELIHRALIAMAGPPPGPRLHLVTGERN